MSDSQTKGTGHEEENIQRILAAVVTADALH
jgi:hypothetical protein